jgi:hypothetical protein
MTTKLQAFNRHFSDLFYTSEYREMARELEVVAFEKGCCFMVAKALQSVLGGELWAVAEWDKIEKDWPLHHYLLGLEGFLLDNTGLYPLKSFLGTYCQRFAGKKRKFHLAPVKGKWPNGPLWEGDHCWEQWAYDKLVADARRIWDTCLNTHDKNKKEPRCDLSLSLQGGGSKAKS